MEMKRKKTFWRRWNCFKRFRKIKLYHVYNAVVTWNGREAF
jgi:hypothetical protein